MSLFLGPVGHQVYLGLRFTFGLKCPMASLLSGAFSVCAQLIYHNLGTASVLSYYPIYTRWEGQGVSVAGANPGVQASSSWYKRLEARGRSKASARVYQHTLPARRAHLMASAGTPETGFCSQTWCLCSLLPAILASQALPTHPCIPLQQQTKVQGAVDVSQVTQ